MRAAWEAPFPKGHWRIAAVAESAATTRCRDDPKTANATSGNSNVYKPVTTGVPAMRV
jgi:hypothetical protein